MRNSKTLLDIELLYAVPLALLSLIFFKTVRLLLRTLVNINANFNKKQSFRWLVFSGEMLKKSLILTSLLVTGPRWNPHVIAAGAGPFDVKESLAIDIKSCLDSAQSWTIGIYSFPQAKAIQHIASHGSNFLEQWHQLKLDPGQYTLGIRYYNWSEKVELPAINVDEHQIINTQLINSGSVNDYFNKLIERDNIFYRCLNDYIFILLICQKWLPKKWVLKEYLPVGDTNNEFLYGVIYKACSLNLQINSSLLNNYDVYLTIYNRSSLPVIWYQIKSEKHTTPVVEKDGFYLVRLRPKLDLASDSFQPNWITIKLLSEVLKTSNGAKSFPSV
ncbi:DUF6208 family protein [aff. Roholtiella sp. LEGE 12411]|uniref:DUF6208 family protein n=1 Tax=aff. Roholtiella sp. LEGE 12411 TaxID=1828822 RepID=UPI001882B00A|nr:DUF6208 family protein [aff. Roholtiella sp. LEGE 12411]MBE9033675.1 hypothetical protein [aff. Roholtiella sp. LEGE 12411]